MSQLYIYFSLILLRRKIYVNRTLHPSKINHVKNNLTISSEIGVFIAFNWSTSETRGKINRYRPNCKLFARIDKITVVHFLFD